MLHKSLMFEPKWFQHRTNIAPGALFGAAWRLLGLSDCILEASCWPLAALERLFEPPESAQSGFGRPLSPSWISKDPALDDATAVVKRAEAHGLAPAKAVGRGVVMSSGAKLLERDAGAPAS